jgi:pimeloyl-ACP methyl ester carboxylesterase
LFQSSGLIELKVFLKALHLDFCKMSRAFLIAILCWLATASAYVIPSRGTLCSSPSSSVARHVSLGLPEPSDNTLWPSSLSPAKTQTAAASTAKATSVERRFYQHEDWKVSFLYKQASAGYEEESPILLIHPVGIGLSSWFWQRFIEEWTNGPAVYAVNLIGCGVTEGSDAWNPDKQGLFFPLSWAQQCETLINTVINEDMTKQRSPLSQLLGEGSPSAVSVVVQGGLAPVGILLAHRNPDAVQNLILTSPPAYGEIATPVPESELQRNYNFLRNPVAGNLAFAALETRWAVRFFSDLFLFEDKCDDVWLDKALEEARPEARPPVQAFNSGFCMHRSLEEEWKSLRQQNILILQGSDDRARCDQREGYTAELSNCEIQTLPGKNVLPWESPAATVEAVKKFLKI